MHPSASLGSQAADGAHVYLLLSGESVLRVAPRVLLVDDDLMICELVELALTDEGWDVQTCTDGQAALELLRERAVDLIVLDLMMPGMDAEAFLATWRQQGAGETPILLLSAAANLDQHADRLGASDSLAKPFDLDELFRAVRQLVA